MFPIFSGLFICLKFGHIEQDDKCTYEQDLVKQFVNETRLNGDPVHYTRALAMLGELQGRLGNLDKAFEALRELETVYDVEAHSAGICKAYGSDRAAQLFGVSSLWCMEQNNANDALRTCQYIINEIMPKMEPRNVHNSAMILYPVIWAMKENGLALEARETFVQFVAERFREHYGEGASTALLPLYEPILMLLDLAGKQSTEVDRYNEYVELALVKDNLCFSKMLNNAMGNLGRAPVAMSAEICLLLAKKMEDGDENKTKLVQNSYDFAREAVELSNKIISHRRHSKKVLMEVEVLAEEMDVL